MNCSPDRPLTLRERLILFSGQKQLVYGAAHTPSLEDLLYMFSLCINTQAGPMSVGLERKPPFQHESQPASARARVLDGYESLYDAGPAAGSS